MSLIENKKARLNYEILEQFEAGIELTGSEVKSLKNKQGSLEAARVSVRGGEVFVLNMQIPPYQPQNAPAEYDPFRVRKLLLTKKEILALATHERGLTIIPISVYNKGRHIKVSIAVVRGKKKYDKRQDIKKRDSEREVRRSLKNR